MRACISADRGVAVSICAFVLAKYTGGLALLVTLLASQHLLYYSKADRGVAVSICAFVLAKQALRSFKASKLSAGR
jgi:ribosomal protein S27E